MLSFLGSDPDLLRIVVKAKNYLAISVSLRSVALSNSSEAMAALIVVVMCASASPILASRTTSAVLARPSDWKKKTFFLKQVKQAVIKLQEMAVFHSLYCS